ncbi:MAG: hypothetical protein WCB11_02260 [Terriglobales bacterium]
MMFFSTTAAVSHLAVGRASFAVQVFVFGLYAHTAFEGVPPPGLPPNTYNYKTFFTTAALAPVIATG